LDQELVEELAGEEHLTLLSSRFEGFDERVVEHFATDAISIGPYVLSGGELPAMVLVDAIARRLPGALGSEESGLVESSSAERGAGLEYPHYTRPADFRGWRVPDVLLSGDHGKIEEWRRPQRRLRAAGGGTIQRWTSQTAPARFAIRTRSLGSAPTPRRRRSATPTGAWSGSIEPRARRPGCRRISARSRTRTKSCPTRRAAQRSMPRMGVPQAPTSRLPRRRT